MQSFKSSAYRAFREAGECEVVEVSLRQRRIIPNGGDAPRALPLAPYQRCQCGVCRECRDNNRWEAIFEKKFADPHYYSGLTLRHSSPLNGDY
jgi:hypothetical protein